MKVAYSLSICAFGLGFTMSAPVAAQEETEEHRRTRVALGPQRVPSYLGSDMLATRPLIDVSRADAGRPRGGIYNCAKYDRLLGEPADSPVVAVFGSRGQFAGEIALPYSLGRGIE